jgi:beta-N-acetylhexosaminidase
VSLKKSETMKIYNLFFLLIISVLISCEDKTETVENVVQTEKSEPTLEQKIGQMLMIGFRGTELTTDNHIYSDIKKWHIGGVVLYDFDQFSNGKVTRNVKSPTQVKKLNKDLQALSETPLLISIDQEGGRVNRLKPVYGFPPITASAQHLGDLDNLDSTKYWTKQTAELLKEMGINFNYAPVLDLNVNPKSPAIGNLERSYSAKPETVTKHAKAVLEIYKEYQIIGSLKHFPGHGSAASDSHLGMTDVSKTWIEKELIPYKNLIEDNVVEVIMTAHVYNENLDTLPATLSKKIMTDILREQLGWKGIIISDDMHMGAIEKHFGLEVAIEKAINAGVDIIMFSNNSKDFYDAKATEKAVGIIKKLVQEGKITEAQIDASYQKIMELKASLIL